jgi:hypothetical protein
MSDRVFEALHARGCRAVRSGTHQVESAATDGGPRWGLSIVLRPDVAAANRLDQLTREAGEVAGSCHWRTGLAASSHITVRSLEPHRLDIAPDDPAVAQYTHALQRGAVAVRPVTLTLGGLILTPISIMVRARPQDSQAELLRAALAERARSIWYVNLVHFAGSLADPEMLIDWVTARRWCSHEAAGHPSGRAKLSSWPSGSWMWK